MIQERRLTGRKHLSIVKALKLAGHTDWRLPNAKELQSIVDYTRSPDATQSAAIDPIFNITTIKNEGGQTDYPNFWSSTTHNAHRGAHGAVYFAFGRALGFMPSRPQRMQQGSEDGRSGGSIQKILMDVHGAGSQRADFKAGDPSTMPEGKGPQGDVMRIYNYVRPVRGGAVTAVTDEPPLSLDEKHAEKARLGNSRQSRFISRLDRNHDNRVSKTEFDGPTRHFDKLDVNHDGYITLNEVPTSPPKRKARRR